MMKALTAIAADQGELRTAIQVVPVASRSASCWRPQLVPSHPPCRRCRAEHERERGTGDHRVRHCDHGPLRYNHDICEAQHDGVPDRRPSTSCTIVLMAYTQRPCTCGGTNFMLIPNVPIHHGQFANIHGMLVMVVICVQCTRLEMFVENADDVAAYYKGTRMITAGPQ